MDVNISEYVRVAADITIISFIIYTLFLSIRKFYLSYHIIGLILLITLYFAANIFNLTMTRTVFQYVIDISLLLWVIIFQKEIKKYLELLPTYIVKVFVPVQSTNTLGEIIDAIKYMSAQHIGALIIFTGQESIYRYSLRKVPLNGLVSKPLLISLFEKSSPTHDGGVIINRNIVESVGVVFSLVERVANNKHGTRHHAAIELSRKTDALIVVVSEENGHVTYARKGKSMKVSLEELKRRISEFGYSNIHHKKYIMHKLHSELVYYCFIWIMVLLYRMYVVGLTV